MLELKSVSKTYHINHNHYSALDDISLSVKAGSIVGIIGKSGAGKSTLIRCMNLLERPTSGSVLLNSIDLTQLNNKALRTERRNISMIFQHFNLLSSRNAYDNIALPLELQGFSKQTIYEIIHPLIELVGLTDHQYHYPDQLSGGQKQRVAIARSLATKPTLLLCDEATSALDPESTQTILQLLKQINQELGLTIVFITHSMTVVKQISDYVGIIDHGKLMEYGDLLSIFTKPKTDITKRLIGQHVHMDLPSHLKDKLQSTQTTGLYPLVRLTFSNEAANVPLTNNIHSRFGVDVNILQADLEYIHGHSLGFMLCHLTADQNAIEQALHYLASQSVQSEVIGYV